MLGAKRDRRLRAALLPLVGAALLPACREWAPVPPPYAATIAETRPSRIRVVTAEDGFEIREPVVAGDTLCGVARDGRTPVRVPLARISFMQRRAVDDDLATGVVLAAAASAASAGWILSILSGDGTDL